MTDVHDSLTRSYNMSMIKGKNTRPELMVRKYLFSRGLRYRVHVDSLPGKPDIVLPKYKTIVDVRGCIWHRHKNCRFGDGVKTKSKTIILRQKQAVERDNRNMREWLSLGWKVIVVWDRCQLEDKKKNSRKREQTLQRIYKEIVENGE